MDGTIYSGRAALYDRVYHWKDYAAEAARVRGWLETLGVASGPPGGPRGRVLDVACGTGSHLAHLRAHFDVSGCDLEPGALEVARAKLPGVELFTADMTALPTREPVDGLTCLFSAIGHLLTRERIAVAAASFVRALRPGGALVVEPWVGPSAFIVGRRHLQTYDGDELKLARLVVGEREGDVSIFVFHYLAARPGQAVEHWTERHEVRLTEPAELVSVFTAAGFDVRFEPDGLMPGRGVLLGTRR